MSYRHFVNTQVTVFRPALNQRSDSHWEEDRPTTPVFVNVDAYVAPLKIEDQFLFGKIANEANFALGHKGQRMFKMFWGPEDIHEYDEVLYDDGTSQGPAHYVVNNIINDTVRRSLKQHVAVLKERTTTY